MRTVAASHTSCSCKKVTPTRKLHVDRTVFCFRRVQCICMLTKTGNRLLMMYDKLIPSFWFGSHLLIVSFCIFVVWFNRSLKPDSSISAWNDEPDNEFAARMQGEANHNCKSYLMFRRRFMRMASFTKRIQ